MKTTVTMPSVTHAIKAKRMLASGGFRSEVRRASKVSDEGCTHVLIVNGDPRNVSAFLNRNRIVYGKIIDTVY